MTERMDLECSQFLCLWQERSSEKFINSLQREKIKYFLLFFHQWLFRQNCDSNGVLVGIKRYNILNVHEDILGKALQTKVQPKWLLYDCLSKKSLDGVKILFF